MQLYFSTIRVVMLPALLCLLLSNVAVADTFHFRSGGLITGTLIGETRESGRKYLELRTETGSVLKFRKSLIKRIETPSPEKGLYLIALKKMPNTPQGHWAMCEWCKEHGGPSKFKNEIEFHLKEIVKLDPSDYKAWQKLDYVKVDGRWVPEEQHFQSLGYRKFKGRWISSTHLALLGVNSNSDEQFNASKKALKKWQNNTLGKKDFDTVRSELFQLVDESTVGYFESRFLRKAKDPRQREFYLEAIGRVPTSSAQRILARYAIEDTDSEVREQAILQLEQEHYPADRSTRYLTVYLNHPVNLVVNRAGGVIGRLKNVAAIVPLIGVLETTHKESTGDDPNRLSTGFDSNGGVSFGTGGPSTVTRRRKNPSVLQALADITEQDFGFDSKLWMEWYITEHTVTNYDVGRDLNDN